MSPLAAWIDGARRVVRAPALLMGVWALTLIVSVPLAFALRAMLAQHLGASLAADTAAGGVNYDWMQEFGDQASGLGTTFKPTIIGFGAVLDNASAFLDATPRPAVIIGAASVYIVLWIFLAGGIIDRYARDRPTRAFGFFAGAGGFFFRFLRLAVVQWLVYAALFGWLHPWLFDTLYPRLTHEMSVERTAFAVRVGLYLVFGAAIALFLLNFGAFVAALAVYGLVARSGGRSALIMWLGVGVGQLYVLARLWIKLTFWASETALFQGRLGHAGYVVRAAPAWPDSPAADAI